MISIIVPIWNSGAFLDDCLTSIASQTEKNWECLLIDDGSDDNSRQICCHWCKLDERFLYFRQAHLGVSAARNKGIIESSGDYIVFVDSDDSVSPTYLEHLLSSSPAELVVGGYIKYYSDDKKNNVRFCPNSTLSFKIQTPYTAAFADLNDKFLLYGPCAKLFISDIVKRNHILFPENRTLGEDLEFNYQYLNHIDTISCITDCDYYYHIRQDRESLTTHRRTYQYYSDLEQWRIIKTFCDNRGVFEDDMKRVLAKRLWEIIYDSLLFKHPTKEINATYYKAVLSTPEITLLADYKNIYPCSCWIKALIINRVSIYFYLYGRFAR